MTNNKLTDDVLEYVLAVVEDRYDNRKSNAGEDDRIILALRELQERRKAEGVYCLATLYEIDGVFTKDPTAIANARGRKVQGYVELEVANRFYKGNKD
ncbi:TPA: hypothetical protein H1895_001578 [Salmonella enterica]|nr:hypothetical protein [Salmonella enterica]